LVIEERFSVSAREPSLRPDGSRSLQIFVLEIDGRPTLALQAPGLAEAQEICRDADLRADLMALTSNGVAICNPESSLSSRPAAHEEILAFDRAVELAPASEQPTMTFLIKIDGVMVVTVGPEQA
jgi:hypothetical protein